MKCPADRIPEVWPHPYNWANRGLKPPGDRKRCARAKRQSIDRKREQRIKNVKEEVWQQ